MIHLSSDYGDLDKEFDRLESMPDFKTKVALEQVLQKGYTQSQKDVHVDTSSLKSSGKTRSESDKGSNTWTGELEYGGASAGANNPVDYAIYEQRRASDELGTHDFFANLHLLHPDFVKAIQMGLSK